MDKKRILRKWVSILEDIGYKGKKWQEMANYAEAQSSLEDNSDLLVLSLKILSDIYNLNNYDFMLFLTGEELEKKEYSYTYELDRELRSVLNEQDSREFLEKKIIKVISSEIGNHLCSFEREINNYIIFNANHLVKSIEVVSEDDKPMHQLNRN